MDRLLSVGIGVNPWLTNWISHRQGTEKHRWMWIEMRSCRRHFSPTCGARRVGRGAGAMWDRRAAGLGAGRTLDAPRRRWRL